MPKLLGTDPTFYPSPRAAMEAPPETLAYVAVLRPDQLAVVDVDPQSATYGQVVGRLELPGSGENELHPFGWNACSSALCPMAPHPHLERRYLILPGTRSWRIYIVDTRPDPKHPRIAKVIEPEELARRTGYSRPHTVHCGPAGIYVSCLGSAAGDDGPGGVFIMDHYTFAPLGRFEVDRGPQYLAYDFWWHIAHDVIVTSEWGTPRQVENGLLPEALLEQQYGKALHFWDARSRRHIQEVRFPDGYQMPLELRSAHDPTKLYRFVGVVINVKDLSASLWVWYREGGEFKIKEIATIPARPEDPDRLPPLLKGFGAVPPLVTDIALSLADRFLYASCWGTGQLLQFDVSDPFEAKLVGEIQIGGIGRHTPRPSGKPMQGDPQMVEVSRNGRRLYFTNSLYDAWDPQFYPDGVRGCLVKANVLPGGGMEDRPRDLRRLRRPQGAPGPAGGRRLLHRFVLLPVAPAGGLGGSVSGDGSARRGASRCVPRHQPGHGLAVRRVPGPAPQGPVGAFPRRAPHRPAAHGGDRPRWWPWWPLRSRRCP